MSLQKIKSLNGKDEYVLLPVAVYQALKKEIDTKVADSAPQAENEFIPFVLDDYVDNPVALARMKADLTQQQLADRLGVTQAYISKVERQDAVTVKLLARVKAALK